MRYNNKVVAYVDRKRISCYNIVTKEEMEI